MSWDATILAFEPEWASPAEIPSGWQPGMIAPRASIVAAILAAFPGATEDDRYKIGGNLGSRAVRPFTIFNHGAAQIFLDAEDPVDSVRTQLSSGANPATIERLVRLAQLLGARALDHQTGEFLTILDGSGSYADWHDFRDRALSGVVSPDLV